MASGKYIYIKIVNIIKLPTYLPSELSQFVALLGTSPARLSLEGQVVLEWIHMLFVPLISPNSWVHKQLINGSEVPGLL